MAVVGRTAPQRLQIGHVVVQTLHSIRENILLFFALSLIFGAASPGGRYWQSTLGESEIIDVVTVIALIAYIVTGYVFAAAVAKAVAVERAGKRASFNACLAAIGADFYALAAFGIIISALWATSVIVSAVYPIALILLIPGLLVEVIFTVVVPVRMIEKPGFVATLKRSSALTKGNRWPIFGLVVASIVLQMILEWVVYTGVGDPAFAGFSAQGRAALLFLVVADMSNGMLDAVATVMIYFELRLIKEGVGPEALAAVFD